MLLSLVESVNNDGPRQVQGGDATNRAIVASDGNGNGCLLHWVGAGLQYMFEEVGSTLEDLGLDDIESGIWVWEGRLECQSIPTDFGYEHDCQLEGMLRLPTDDEWAAVRRNECPWPPAKGELIWDEPEELNAARGSLLGVLSARAAKAPIVEVIDLFTALKMALDGQKQAAR